MWNRSQPRILLLTLLALTGLAHAEQTGTDPVLASVGSPAPSSFETFLRHQVLDPAILAIWQKGEALELEGHLMEAARSYESVIAALPERSHPYWRTARSYWRFGDELPLEEKSERIRYFERAREWAARGLERDPDCAGCMLWEFASMGRLATERGVLSAMGSVPRMAELLERGIALQPTYRDDADNSLLGNLYLSGSKFYRIVPDSILMKWLMGVRGDKERGLQYSRKAAALASARIDYQVELGVALLCLGARKGNPDRTREGHQVLAQAANMPTLNRRERLAAQHAQMLGTHPERACGYTSTGQIEIDPSELSGPGAENGSPSL